MRMNTTMTDFLCLELEKQLDKAVDVRDVQQLHRQYVERMRQRMFGVGAAETAGGGMGAATGLASVLTSLFDLVLRSDT